MEADPFWVPPASHAEALVTGDEIGAPRPISVPGAGGFRVCALAAPPAPGRLRAMRFCVRAAGRVACRHAYSGLCGHCELSMPRVASGKS